MLDILAVLSLIALFGLSLLYTSACDGLKGNKQ